MMSAGLTLESATDARSQAGLVGPNAVIQLAAALKADRSLARTAQQVFTSAGFASLLDKPPTEMIDEAVPHSLFAALWREVPDDQATRIAYDAGRRTADYILAHRIPALAQLVLKALPASAAAPLLLKAIRKNAWTFAGSGECTVGFAGTAEIAIAANPLAMPGCPWHCGVFERLFQVLVAPASSARHIRCCADGHRACRFEIDICNHSKAQTQPVPRT